MADNLQGERGGPMDIPWWPGAVRLLHIAFVAQLDQVDFTKLVGMTYADFPLAEPLWLEKGYGEYVFGSWKRDEGPTALAKFIFNPVLTAELKAKPVFTNRTSRVHPWPAVLEGCVAVFDAATPVIRRALRPAVSVSCRMRERVFVSDREFTDEQVATDEPVPGEVQADYYGVSLQIPACLHPLVVVESRFDYEGVKQNLTPTRADIELANTRTLKPTNHQRWRTHKFHNEAQYDNGLFYRTEIEVDPPPAPPIIYA